MIADSTPQLLSGVRTHLGLLLPENRRAPTRRVLASRRALARGSIFEWSDQNQDVASLARDGLRTEDGILATRKPGHGVHLFFASEELEPSLTRFFGFLRRAVALIETDPPCDGDAALLPK